MLFSTPEATNLIKFIALSISFLSFMICIMALSKKNYKIVPLLSVMLTLGFIAYCISVSLWIK